MKKMSSFLLALIATAGSLSATDLHDKAVTEQQQQHIGFVNFKSCVEKSKQGQQEKNGFDILKKQMTDSLEKADKELEETAKKLEDQTYMDSLSPTAEEELKHKFQNLTQEYSQKQNQFYQLLNQANFKMLQTLHDEVSAAAEKIRVNHKYTLILNEDSAFAHSPSLDMTTQVIEQMNQKFDAENGNKALTKKE